MKTTDDQMLPEDQVEFSKVARSSCKYYAMWFIVGAIWGLLSQLAMVGFTMLSLRYEVGLSLWFERSIVIAFSVVTMGVPFALYTLMGQILEITTETVDQTIMDHIHCPFHHFSRLFTIFFMLGTMVSLRQ